ncbi:MAG: hypothetical protein R6U43_05410 [Candidatus Krumholzibacteriales bacterium]
MKRIIYLLAAVSLVFFQSTAAGAANGYVDFPSFFNSIDSSSVITEFGFSIFDEDAGYLYSSSASGRINDRLTGSFDACYFSINRDDRIQFGFGDFTINLTFQASGDSLGTSGIFLRTDIRLPSGAKALQPFASRSFDGGAGMELRDRFSLFTVRLAGTYTFAEERNAEGIYPHSNYSILAASAGMDIGPARLMASGYWVDYRKSGDRRVLLSSLSGRLSENFSIILTGGVEAGDDYERLFDSIFSLRLAYRFPSAENEQ